MWEAGMAWRAKTLWLKSLPWHGVARPENLHVRTNRTLSLLKLAWQAKEDLKLPHRSACYQIKAMNNNMCMVNTSTNKNTALVGASTQSKSIASSSARTGCASSTSSPLVPVLTAVEGGLLPRICGLPASTSRFFVVIKAIPAIIKLMPCPLGFLTYFSNGTLLFNVTQMYETMFSFTLLDFISAGLDPWAF